MYDVKPVKTSGTKGGNILEKKINALEINSKGKCKGKVVPVLQVSTTS
jgi:hypothetical protein